MVENINNWTRAELKMLDYIQKHRHCTLQDVIHSSGVSELSPAGIDEAVRHLKETAFDVDWADEVLLHQEIAKLPFAEMEHAPYQGKIRDCLSPAGLDSDTMAELLAAPKTEEDIFFFLTLLYKARPAVQRDMLGREELRRFLAFLDDQKTDKFRRQSAIVCILQIPGGKAFLAEYFPDAASALYPGMQWGESLGREVGESLKRIQARIEEAISLVSSILPNDSHEVTKEESLAGYNAAIGLSRTVGEELSGAEFALSNSPDLRVQTLLDNAKYILLNETNPYAVLPLAKRPKSEFEAQTCILDMTGTTGGLSGLIEQGNRILTYMFFYSQPEGLDCDKLDLELIIFALIDLWRYAIGQENFERMRKIFDSLQDLDCAMEYAEVCYPWIGCRY